MIASAATAPTDQQRANPYIENNILQIMSRVICACCSLFCKTGLSVTGKCWKARAARVLEWAKRKGRKNGLTKKQKFLQVVNSKLNQFNFSSWWIPCHCLMVSALSVDMLGMVAC